MVRCKFICETNKQFDGYQTSNLQFRAVTGGSPENDEFFAATPAGLLTFYNANPDAAKQFNVGEEYYLDISPCSKTEPQVILADGSVAHEIDLRNDPTFQAEPPSRD